MSAVENTKLLLEIEQWQHCTGCRTPEAAEKMIADDRKELLRVRRDAAVAWDRCVELERAIRGANK